MRYVGTTFTMKINSNDKILRDNIVNKQNINGLNDLKSLIGVGLHLQLKLRRLFGLSEYHFFPYRPSLRFQAQVPSTLYVLCVCESLIQTYINGAFSFTFRCNFILKFEFGDLERSWSTGEDLEIVLYKYSVYRED
jgi:hypothetical protein